MIYIWYAIIALAFLAGCFFAYQATQTSAEAGGPAMVILAITCGGGAILAGAITAIAQWIW